VTGWFLYQKWSTCVYIFQKLAKTCPIGSPWFEDTAKLRIFFQSKSWLLRYSADFHITDFHNADPYVVYLQT
jgi:hypothetical protein